MRNSLRFFSIGMSVMLLMSIGSVLFAQEEVISEDPVIETETDVSYPIAELGNCGSKDECRAYCDNPDHTDACLAWAEAQGIEVNHERPVEVSREGGPGGCTSEEECHAYCEEKTHFGECVSYAEEHGRVTAEEAKKIRSRLSQNGEPKTGPGGCDSHEACQAYCSVRSHMEECITFAVSEGRISQEQADKILRSLRGDVDIPRVKPPRVHAPRIDVEVEPSINVEKVQKLLEDQKGPGGCDSFSACETYCNDPTHEDECFTYATEHDLLPKEELERITKLRTTKGPGGCQGRACEQYCEEPGHEKECLEFAREQGFIAEEEYTKIKKFVDLEGPGGCRGRSCEQYCEDAAHRKECFAFAKENGLIDEKEAEVMDRIQNKMETSGGPGGCRDEITCRGYCMDQAHFNECAAFAVDTGLIPPDQAQMMLKQFIDIEQFGAEGSPGGFRPPMMDRMGPPAGFEPMGDFNGDELPPEYRVEFERRMQEFEKFREQFKEDNGMMTEHMMPPQGFDGTQFNMPPGGDQFIPHPDSTFPDYQQQYNDQVQSEFQKQFDTQFQQEYQEQYQQQFEQQYQQQYQQQYDQNIPNTGTQQYEFFQQPPPEYTNPEYSKPPLESNTSYPQYPSPDFSSPPPTYEAPPAGASPFQIFLELFGLKSK